MVHLLAQPLKRRPSSTAGDTLIAMAAHIGDYPFEKTVTTPRAILSRTGGEFLNWSFDDHRENVANSSDSELD
jgi:hypothetical protein